MNNTIINIIATSILHSILLSLIFVIIIYAGCLCQNHNYWEDTPFNENPTSNILSSKYHLIQIYGDVSYRKTNYFEDPYLGSASWLTTRLTFPRLSKISEKSLRYPDPYFISIFKEVDYINWENRLDYGLGIEWRPFYSLNDWLFWLRFCRLYIEYYKTVEIRYSSNDDWRSNFDIRCGVELYKECNLYNNKLFWYEVWSDFSWRKTNFYVNNYKGWTLGIAPKFGVKLFHEKEYAIMPYLLNETTLTGFKEFWLNRILLGVGIRFMPFRWCDGISGILLRGSKYYFEWTKLVHNFYNSNPYNNINYDFRVGMTYAIVNW